MPNLSPNRADDRANPSQGRDALFIGVDPGVHGGVAVLDWIGGVVAVTKMPEQSKELWFWLQEAVLAGARHRCLACVELVTGWVGGYNREGGEEEQAKTNPGSSMLQLGRRVGWVEMLLAGLGIGWDSVSPAVWQRALDIEPRGSLTHTQWKNLLKDHARILFPETKVTLATADALLIAEHCRRKYGSK